jgi:hypothetical protein
MNSLVIGFNGENITCFASKKQSMPLIFLGAVDEKLCYFYKIGHNNCSKHLSRCDDPLLMRQDVRLFLAILVGLVWAATAHSAATVTGLRYDHQQPLSVDLIFTQDIAEMDTESQAACVQRLAHLFLDRTGCPGSGFVGEFVTA